MSCSGSRPDLELADPADLVASLISGKLCCAVAELAALPRAAVVVKDRYSAVFKLTRVRPRTMWCSRRALTALALAGGRGEPRPRP